MGSCFSATCAPWGPCEKRALASSVAGGVASDDSGREDRARRDLPDGVAWPGARRGRWRQAREPAPAHGTLSVRVSACACSSELPCALARPPPWQEEVSEAASQAMRKGVKTVAEGHSLTGWG